MLGVRFGSGLTEDGAKEKDSEVEQSDSEDEDESEQVPPAEAAECPRDVLVASEVADLCSPALRDLLADTAVFMSEDVQEDNRKTVPSRTAQKRALTELDWTMA